MLKKELYRMLDVAGHSFERADIKQHLSALRGTVLTEDGKCLAVRSQCLDVCGDVIHTVAVVMGEAFE
jgi:hypothetical protein